MSRLKPEHWLLLAGFLIAVSTVLSALDSWDQLVDKPAVIGGFAGLLAIQIRTIFVVPNPPKDDLGAVDLKNLKP